MNFVFEATTNGCLRQFFSSVICLIESLLNMLFLAAVHELKFVNFWWKLDEKKGAMGREEINGPGVVDF